MTTVPYPLQEPLTHDEAHAHHDLGFLKRYIFSTDHKIIGIQFLLMGLTFFVVGGMLAMLIRWQLGWPSRAVPILGSYMTSQGAWSTQTMPGDFYLAALTMHASIMIFFVIIPLLVGVFGNYLIPLKIGTADMAFPFLNGMAFWSALPAGAIMVASFFLPGGPAQAGWTSYDPLSQVRLNDGMLPYAAPSGTGLVREGETFVQSLRIGNAPAGSQPGWQGTWPATALLSNFAALFMACMYICAYYVRLDDQSESGRESRLVWALAAGLLLLAFGLVGLVLRAMGPAPYVLTPWGDFFPLISVAAVLAGIALLIQRGTNGAVAVVVSMTGAFLLVKGIQYAAFDGQAAWFLSLTLLGFSSIAGAVNYLTTIIKLRCPGMTMFRLPLSVWSLFITSILVLLATPVLAAALTMNLLDHLRLTSFFLPFNWVVRSQLESNSGGGYALLHQHLFWFYSHPAVYIMILPAMGMVSDILSNGARKPVFGYRPMVVAMAAIAFLGFVVWAHHMFQSGMNPTLGTGFAISTMFIAVPSAIKTFNWLGTLWGGNIRFTTAMWNAIAFVSMFVIGGLSGIFMAAPAVDAHIHDTYFIVAHIHYVLFGASTFGIFASIYFWYPKMFGRMMNETMGKIHFWLSFISFNCCFFPMHILGLGGMLRRAAEFRNYPTFAHFDSMNQFISISAFVLGAAQILIVINFIGSWIWGARAGKNPWEATTLEWETTSPPPHGNFEKVPVVHHGPYEYSSPLVAEDYLMQTRYVEVIEEAHA